MADREKTVDVLRQLKVADIDPDWVKSVWDADFGEFTGLPADIEEDYSCNNYHVSDLEAAQNILLPWAQGAETPIGEGFWSILVEEGIHHRNLIALLFGIMETGLKKKANTKQREAAILSAGLYYLVIRVPGSGAFKIFHTVLLERSLMLFKLWAQLEQVPTNRKRPLKSKDKTHSTSKSQSKTRRTDSIMMSAQEDLLVDDDDGDNEDDDDDDDDGYGSLNSSDLRKLETAFLGLLRNYVKLLSTFSFHDNEQSALMSLQTLVELVKIKPEAVQKEFNISVDEMKSVPQLSFKGLLFLCSEMHGSPAAVLRSMLRYLLPLLLLLTENNKCYTGATVPRPLQTIQNNTIYFICYIMETMPREKTEQSLYVLLQHMCAKVPDKTEYRTRVAQAIIIFLKGMSSLKYVKFIEWLYKYSRHEKISWRGFAIDIISLLLQEQEREDTVDVPGELHVFFSHHFLLQVLLSRCSDVAASVRSRAISAFAQCTSSDKSSLVSVVKDVLTPAPVTGRPPMSRVIATPDNNRVEAEVANQISAGKTPLARLLAVIQQRTPQNCTDTPARSNTSTGLATIELTPGVMITLSDCNGVTSMLRRRAADAKVNVRRAALQALESTIRIMPGVNKQDLDIIEERCRDPALSIRKQAIQCLTSLLLDQPSNKLTQRAWLSGVLPLVVDKETSIQEKCVETVKTIILDNLMMKDRSVNDYHHMAWSLLRIIADHTEIELRQYFQKVCHAWSKAKQLKPQLMSTLQTHVGTENNKATWILLTKLTPFISRFDASFVVDYWVQFARDAPDEESYLVEQVLEVLGQVAKYLPAEKCEELAYDLKQRLMKFDSVPELIVVTVNTLNKLCLARGQDQRSVQKLTEEWFGDLLKACDEYLSSVILSNDQESTFDEDAIIRRLFMLGEMVQLCPTQTPKRVFMLVQSLVATPVITSGGDCFADEHFQASRGSTESQQHADTNGMPQDGALEQSSPNTSSDPQTTQTSSQSSQSSKWQGSSLASQPISQFRGSKMSSCIRAHAFITLGKMCLLDRNLAKRCVPAFARELEVSTDMAVRNNIVIVLTDLCIRYATLIDIYVPDISSCLKDSCPLIRKQCLICLTRLLQEDFLKWKGTLFYHFISTLVDEVKEIRECADFCLMHLFQKNQSAMFYQHFTECIFYFNGYECHTAYNKFNESQRQRQLFCMKGKDNYENRMTIYRYLLEHLEDEHRFQLTAKLCQDVLAEFLDGALPLSLDSIPVLQDTLHVLISKEIKLKVMSKKSIDSNDVEDDSELAMVVLNVARKKLITQAMKKNVIENVIPTVISLKHMLDRNHSPLLKDLMMFLNELMKDYKMEVRDVLDADPQLAKEIEFDLRRFEEENSEQNKTSQQDQRQPRVNVNSEDQGTPQVTEHTASPKSSGANSVAIPDQEKTPRNLPSWMSAIRNSARKVVRSLEKSKNTGGTPSGDSTFKEGQSLEGKRVVFKDLTSSMQSLSAEKAKTPNRRINTRATSTPSADLTIGNFTFQHDVNLSVIPGSPLMQAHRISSEGDSDRRTPDQFIISMQSPDKPLPKAKKWNIKRPASINNRCSIKSEGRSPVLEATDDNQHLPLVPRRSPQNATDSSDMTVTPKDTSNQNLRPRATRSKQTGKISARKSSLRSSDHVRT